MPVFPLREQWAKEATGLVHVEAHNEGDEMKTETQTGKNRICELSWNGLHGTRSVFIRARIGSILTDRQSKKVQDALFNCPSPSCDCGSKGGGGWQSRFRTVVIRSWISIKGNGLTSYRIVDSVAGDASAEDAGMPVREMP